jgi:hypothetical protein
MKNKIIVFLIFSTCLFNQAFSQIYNNGQGLKRSSLRKVEKIRIKDTFILGGISMNSSQSSGFVMGGTVKKFGGYLKLNTNLNFNGTYSDKGYSQDPYRYFDGKTQNGHHAATGGLLFRITKPLIFYGGLGYVNRWVNWETVSGDNYRVTDISYQGLEIETGLLLKTKNIFFSCGISACQDLEFDIGIGVKLKSKK